jgi:hypothetical protein
MRPCHIQLQSPPRTIAAGSERRDQALRRSYVAQEIRDG